MPARISKMENAQSKRSGDDCMNSKNGKLAVEGAEK